MEKYKSIQFEGSEDKYVFPLLSVRQTAPVFAKFLSVALPILAASFDKMEDFELQKAEILKMGEEGIGISPEVDLFDVSVLLSQQLIKPEFNDILEGLIPELTKNGSEISLDEAFYGEFDKYMKLVEFSFRENLLIPLMRYLEEKGLSGMLTSLQGALTVTKGTMN